VDPNKLPKPPQGPDDYHPPLPEDSDAPIPFDIEDEPVAAPKPAAPARPAAAVSHAPLTMGAAATAGTTPGAPRAAARPAQPKAAPAKPAGPRIVINKPPERHVADIQTSSDDRVCGVKTFFTKLHPGAMDFLDDQINDWLKAHPEVRVKMTNTCVGEVASKKSEPNIILTVWY